jgi:hypothetical protein
MPCQILRREASSFGDPRERAEVMDANHLEICKFESAEDPAYRALSFTILRFVGDEFNRVRITSTLSLSLSC